MGNPLDRFIGFRLAAAHRRMDRRLNRALAGIGITQAQAHLLSCLLGGGEQRAADLSRHTGLEQSTVSRLMRQLAGRRLVRHRPHPDDRRARLWRPGKRAVALQSEIQAILLHAQRRLARNLTEQDLEGFARTVASLDELP